MLVVPRKKNESIVINDDITVTVVEIRGDKVRLEVEAPRNVPVHRREVFDAIHRNKLAAEDEAGSHEASYLEPVVVRPKEVVVPSREVPSLVVFRKQNESIVINDDITIVVVEIRGDKVRLGVEAPRNVPVHRREVFDAIHPNRLAAEGKLRSHKTPGAADVGYGKSNAITKCPFCQCENHRVIDSRTSQDGFTIRRRHECLACKRRYTTYERIEGMSVKIVKKDGTREPFDRSKSKRALEKACWKRPVSDAQLEAIITAVENELEANFESEVDSRHVGELFIEHLRQLDQVAYVRFASVYRQFGDIHDFVTELRPVKAGSHEASYLEYLERVVDDPKTFANFIRGLEDNPLSEEEIAQISDDFVQSLSF